MRQRATRGPARGRSILLAVALLVPSAAPRAADGEVAICASAETRAAVRDEMRRLLDAVHGVHAALAERDFGALAERAAAAGGAMRDSVEKGGDRGHPPGLPHEFVKLGIATHAAFDELATLARDDARPRELLPALSAVTGHCVACHARYRLTADADCAVED